MEQKQNASCISTASRGGYPKAKRVPKQHIGFRSTPKFLATIDFGTTHCSVAYIVNAHVHDNPSEMDPIILMLDVVGRHRVPSCILFDPNGKKVAFGFKARTIYCGMDHEERPNYTYFEHIKRHLQREENVNRNLKIQALNGRSYFLVEVIAQVLHHLKEKVITAVKELGFRQLSASDFDWVITVPAIWKGKGKQMMREAGYRAGLCSGETPLPLQQTRGALAIKEEKSPDKLSLALEPESAAIHCRRAAKEAGKSTEFRKAKNYLVVDIGGSTVDIATHALVGEHIEELAPSAGNIWGGMTVNEAFQDFLEDFVDDPDFSKYTQVGDKLKTLRHKADLNKLCFQIFELNKQRFGNDEDIDSYLIEFPRSFWRVYEDKLEEKGRKLLKAGKPNVLIEDDGPDMRLFPTKMEEFFSPTVNGISTLLEQHLRPNLVDAIDTIYWVGGFGGCKYLRRKLEEKLAAIFRSKRFHFAIPPRPELAVIRGATAFRLDPNVVGKRKADTTYGIRSLVLFDPSIHRPDYKQWCPQRRQHYCTNIFNTIVSLGESISTNEIFAIEFTPVSFHQTNMSFDFFSCCAQNVRYTTEDGVLQLGSLSVAMGGKGLDRKVEVVFEITHAEIHVRARDLTYGFESKLVVDFMEETGRTELIDPSATGSSSISCCISSEDVPDLLTLLSPLAGSWELFLRQLIPKHEVEAISAGRQGGGIPKGPLLCLSDGLDYLVDSGDSHAYDRIINILCGCLFSNADLGRKVEEFAKSKL